MKGFWKRIFTKARERNKEDMRSWKKKVFSFSRGKYCRGNRDRRGAVGLEGANPNQMELGVGPQRDGLKKKQHHSVIQWVCLRDFGTSTRKSGKESMVGIIKTMVFPVVIYRCESWTIRKTEH